MQQELILSKYLTHEHRSFLVKDKKVVQSQEKNKEKYASVGVFGFLKAKKKHVLIGVFSLEKDNPPHFTNQVFKKNFNLFLGDLLLEDQENIKIEMKEESWRQNTLTVEVDGKVFFKLTYEKPIFREIVNRFFYIFDSDFGYNYVSVDIGMYVMKMIKTWRPGWIKD